MVLPTFAPLVVKQPHATPISFKLKSDGEENVWIVLRAIQFVHYFSPDGVVFMKKFVLRYVKAY